MANNWTAIQVLKFLWVAIKTNRFNSITTELYRYLLKVREKVTVKARNEGLQAEHIHYIYAVFEHKLNIKIEVGSSPVKSFFTKGKLSSKAP